MEHTMLLREFVMNHKLPPVLLIAFNRDLLPKVVPFFNELH